MSTISIDAKVDESVERLRARYDMQPHPEGGYYAELYRSPTNVNVHSSLLDNECLSVCTHIFYMLVKNNYSAWHRIKSDEIWHWHVGGELKIHVLQPDFTLKTVLLGNPLLNEEASLTYCVPAGLWFAAELADKSQFAMVGCTVAPGFEFQHFELASDEQLRDYRLAGNDEQTQTIQRLLKQ